jgi:hypothetical protein
MKTVSIPGFLLLFFLLLGCDKLKEDINRQYTAEIVGFDLNCNTCIVSFPEDSLEIAKLFGESPDNCYEIINLFKDNLKIGQALKVTIRKAEDSELLPCITLYASWNCKKLYVLDYVEYSNLRLNDTVDLAYKDCLYDFNRQSYICLDSVLEDSRCPEGLFCIWAGQARARFKIEKYNSNPVYIDIKEGANDVVVSGYSFSFIKLLPYPKYGNQINAEEYKARIVIKSN